ncbi:MAG TPA: hypothetical protein VGK29_02945 [Paludibaculum sp.]|jgi:hypothetical protein
MSDTFRSAARLMLAVCIVGSATTSLAQTRKTGPTAREFRGTISVTVSGSATMKDDGNIEPLSQTISRSAQHYVEFKEADMQAEPSGQTTLRGREISFAADVNDRTTGSEPRTGKASGGCPGGRDANIGEAICALGAVVLVLLPGQEGYGFTFNSIAVLTPDETIRVPGFRIGPIPLPAEPWKQLSGRQVIDLAADESMGIRREGERRRRNDTGRMRDGVFTWVPLTAIVTWNLALPAPRLEITKLEQQGGPKTGNPEQMVYENGVLRLQAEATVTPASEAASVRWNAPAIGEVQPVVQSAVRAGGMISATITWRGMPARNSDFGGKTLKATLQDCVAERRFQVFFDRDGTGNPQSRGSTSPQPNWYVYWKQGPVPELDRFGYSNDPSMAAGYSPTANTLTVTGEAPGVIPGLNVQLRTKDGSKTYHLIRERCEGIRAVAAIVRHELRHKELHEMNGADYDFDAVVDAVEEKSSDPWLDIFQPNTYSNFDVNLFYSDLDKWLSEGNQAQRDARKAQVEDHRGQLRVKGDNELLAIIAEGRKKANEKEDWAFPGSQAVIR